MNELDQAYANAYKLASNTGVKFPEIIAAMYMHEAAGGKSPSGRYNYFGIKAGANEDGVSLPTHEYRNGRRVNINAKFKNYETEQGAFNELAERWFKDYKGYKGVDNAKTRQGAVQELKNQGYATDPSYVKKILNTISKYEYLNVKPKPKPVVPAVKPAKSKQPDPWGNFLKILTQNPDKIIGQARDPSIPKDWPSRHDAKPLKSIPVRHFKDLGIAPVRPI